jgi:nucleoside-diphosphate-sugar epimerase
MIFITGATGFVGPHLLKHLNAQSYLIKGINLRNPNWYSELDADVSTIIHLAGKAHDLKKVTNPHEYYEANFELTKQVFDSFLLSDASVFIFMSSVKATADEVKDILTEENSPNPKTHYGISKFQAESYILNQQLPEGKRVYILRPCMIHGPGNQGNLNLLYKLTSRGIPWPLGAFDNKRSFCSIDNLMFVIKELIERDDIPSGVYNVSDDIALSTNEVISILAESQNRKPKICNISKGLIEYAAKIGNVLKLPLNEERLQKLTDSYVVSNQKIKTAIGKPLPVSSREGLLKTFNSFKN